MLLPPWMNTITGRSRSSVAGRQMFSDRQSSLPGVLPEAMFCPTVASNVLLLPGLYRRGFWMHELPNARASSVPAQGAGATGARQRKLPTGALAKGMPFQNSVPLRAASFTPATAPYCVLRIFGSSSLPPQAPSASTPAAASAPRPRLAVIQFIMACSSSLWVDPALQSPVVRGRKGHSTVRSPVLRKRGVLGCKGRISRSRRLGPGRRGGRRPADGARYSTSGVRGGSASSSSSESVRASLSSMMGMPSRMG